MIPRSLHLAIGGCIKCPCLVQDDRTSPDYYCNLNEILGHPSEIKKREIEGKLKDRAFPKVCLLVPTWKLALGLVRARLHKSAADMLYLLLPAAKKVNYDPPPRFQWVTCGRRYIVSHRDGLATIEQFTEKV